MKKPSNRVLALVYLAILAGLVFLFWFGLPR
jgi:hypothetical protein